LRVFIFVWIALKTKTPTLIEKKFQEEHLNTY
jgi:hypothetical protein